ncbi:MAG: mycothiol synthase [Acidimicrobiales bacterium]
MSLEIRGPLTGPFRWSIVVPETRTAPLDELLDGAEEPIDGAGDVQLWIRDARSADDGVARRHGFEPYRDLWQLRCELPVERSSVRTRGFAPADLDALVEVNNRAFHWHPEQGGITADEIRSTMTEPWFDPDGLRLHHVEDRLAGFCWTKVHPDHLPPLGEIYVIAVDPDFHGRGLGVGMTRAGLDWLAARGLDRGMLYVESDNEAANATYDRIGFLHHHTDRAYRRPAGR